MQIPIEELKPGMQLMQSVQAQGETLLEAERPVTQEEIDTLRERSPDQIVDVSDESNDQPDEGESAAPDAESVAAESVAAESVYTESVDAEPVDLEAVNAVRERVSAAVATARDRFADRVVLSELLEQEIESQISAVLNELEGRPKSAVLLGEIFTNQGDYLAAHAGSVLYLSIMLGVAIRAQIQQGSDGQRPAGSDSQADQIDLTPLGLGALFMDVGMAPLRELHDSGKPLSRRQIESVREHPKVGARKLPADFDDLARQLVGSHHENCDRSGYPRGLGSRQVHVFARILRITDAFDAATATRTYRRCKSPARALWEMTVGPYRTCYDQMLTRVFAQLIQPFPIGSKVRLADGRFAVVVRHNNRDPFNLYLVIAFDRDNKRLPDTRLDGPFRLRERPEIHVNSFGDEDVSFVHETSCEVAKAIGTGEFKTIFDALYP